MKKNILFLCLLCSVTMTVGGVRAGQAAAPTTNEPPTLNKVKKLFREGRALFVKRMFASSLSPLRKSFSMLGQLLKQAKTPAKKKLYRKYEKAFLATMGIAYHWNRQYVKSYQFYMRCVAEKPSKKLVQLCRNNLPKVLRFLAHLEIETQPSKARLLLSWSKGKKASKPSPLKKWVSPGVVDVQIQSKGCVSIRRRLLLQPGIRAKFLFHLQKPATCSTGKPASVKVSPGDRVVLGSLGMTSTVAGGASAPPPPSAIPQPFGSPLAGWQIGLIVGGAVAGAALIGLGSYGVVVALNNRDKFVIK